MIIRLRPLALLLALTAAVTAAAAKKPPPPPPAREGLLVTSRGSRVVLEYDLAGNFVRTFAADAELVRPVGITFGADGDVYVGAGDTSRILRFGGADGSAKGVFAHGGNIESPRRIAFGPDGALYVADGFRNEVTRYDPETGELRDVFVTDPALQGANGFAFGPDGDLYVVSVLSNQVLRFDGTTGALVGPFASEHLALPHDVTFGPDGNLYVTNSDSRFVERFAGADGAYLGPFISDAGLNRALGMAWGLDGNLYIANQLSNEVRRYDGISGELIDVLVPPGSGGLASAAFLAFRPAAKLTLKATARSQVPALQVAISGAPPGARLLLVQGKRGNGGKLPQCPALKLGVKAPQVVETRIADGSGNAVTLLKGERGSKLSLLVVDTRRCVATKPLAVTLP